MADSISVVEKERKMEIIDSEGNKHETSSPDFDLQKLREEGLFPEDYELCGTCEIGDHNYDFPLAGPEEQWESILAHLKAGDKIDANFLCVMVTQVCDLDDADYFLSNLKKYNVLNSVEGLEEN
jgi:hypothetical protein